MRILFTGACGFVGSTLARAFAEAGKHSLIGFDNFIRPGSETNRQALVELGVNVFHSDLRAASDVDALPACDWVIDAAANPSVLAGADGRTTSRQVVEHNLVGTLNVLEYCKRHRAGLILLSTSRVYSSATLSTLKVEVADRAFRPAREAATLAGLTAAGVNEAFSSAAPLSLYGATKLASETLALEYGDVFQFPVFINRCGVLAGAGQFGRPDQGIFAYWINRHLRRQPLRYLGFDGQGHQVRDCLHPRDLVALLERQFSAPTLSPSDRVTNVSGGLSSAISLRQLTDWCDGQFGAHPVASDGTPRPFDVPWLVLDYAKAHRLWQWQPTLSTPTILVEIADHARAHPRWLELSAVD